MKRFIPVLLAALSALLLSSCSATVQSHESFVMNTVIRQTIYAPNADITMQNNKILQDIEEEMSKTIDTSDVGKLNASQGPVSYTHLADRFGPNPAR